MREIVWSDEARQEYIGAIEYLAPRNPDAATRLRNLIDKTVFALAETPSGRRGRVTDTYEKVLQAFPYIIAYALEPMPQGERLVVLGVVHAKRDWTSEKWPEID